MLRTDAQFWLDLDELVATSEVLVDRPAGQPHPDFPELIYPFDYGCLAATTGGDGAEIDVWIGSLTELTVTAVACTVDRYKRDAELKVFLGCSEDDLARISTFLRVEAELPHLLILRGSRASARGADDRADT